MANEALKQITVALDEFIHVMETTDGMDDKFAKSLSKLKQLRESAMLDLKVSVPEKELINTILAPPLKNMDEFLDGFKKG